MSLMPIEIPFRSRSGREGSLREDSRLKLFAFEEIPFRQGMVMATRLGTRQRILTSASLGIEAIHTGMTKRFWFGENTKIDLPGELPGLIPTPSWFAENEPEFNWSVSATVNVSIGQGRLEMTPLQLALNTAAAR